LPFFPGDTLNSTFVVTPTLAGNTIDFWQLFLGDCITLEKGYPASELPAYEIPVNGSEFLNKTSINGIPVLGWKMKVANAPKIGETIVYVASAAPHNIIRLHTSYLVEKYQAQVGLIFTFSKINNTAVDPSAYDRPSICE